jgi:hypothetical protein
MSSNSAQISRNQHESCPTEFTDAVNAFSKICMKYNGGRVGFPEATFKKL